MRRSIVGYFFALVFSLSNLSAWAQTPLSVLGIEAVDAPDNLALRLAESLKAQIRQDPSIQLVEGQSLDEIKLVFSCVEEKPDCMAAAGKSLKVTKLVWGTLKKAPGGYNLTIKMLDVSEARVEKFLSNNYAPEDLEEGLMLAVVEKLARSLLGGKLGSIKITCPTLEAQVQLDSHPVGVISSEGLLLPDLTPGSHELVIRKDGFHDSHQTVVVKAGETAPVKATLEPSTPSATIPPQTEEPSDTSRTGLKVAFWTGVAVPLGLGTAAIITGLQYKSSQNDFDALRDQSPPLGIEDLCAPATNYEPSAEVLDLCDKGQSRARLSTIFWISSGAVAVATAVLGYFAYRSQESATTPESTEQAKRQGQKTVHWNLTPSVSPAGASMGLQLRF
jgi:hypothetical protein